MPQQKYYEGQEFHNPNDPSAPVLVYRKGRFFPKETAAGGTDPQAFRRAQDSVAAIDDATKRTGFWTTGMVGGFLADNLRGSPAYNLDKDLETLKARTAFNELAAMRAASPTGGALGAVSDREMSLLQASEANLDVGQGEAQIDKNLARMRNTLTSRTPGLDVGNPIEVTGTAQLPEGAYFRRGGKVYRQQKGAGATGGQGVRNMSNDDLKKALGL